MRADDWTVIRLLTGIDGHTPMWPGAHSDGARPGWLRGLVAVPGVALGSPRRHRGDRAQVARLLRVRRSPAWGGGLPAAPSESGKIRRPDTMSVEMATTRWSGPSAQRSSGRPYFNQLVVMGELPRHSRSQSRLHPVRVLASTSSTSKATTALACWLLSLVPLFLLDDHEVVRRGCATCSRPRATSRSCGEAGTAEEALARVPPSRPDVAVLDVRLPDGNGVEVCREIRSHARSQRA